MFYFKIFSRLSSLILVVFSFAFAQTEVNGLINSNTTWDSTGSPYIVTGNIAVMNATLNIGPGVEVKFNQDLNMQILSGGEIIAIGNEQDSIEFTGNGNGVTWGGIILSENSIGSLYQNDTTYISGSVFIYSIFNLARRESSYGGAIETNVNLLITNSRFENNSVFGDGLNNGGAIHCDWDKILHIYKSSFISNSTSGTGGAVSHADLIMSCNFSKNYSSWGAGAVKGCDIIKNTIFEDNTADHGSGGAVSSAGSILNCRFVNNSASISNCNGGAINNVKYVYDSEFINNSARSGGAIYTHGLHLYIYNSVFKSNTAQAGGAILFSDDKERNFSIDNSVFISNESGNEGAIRIYTNSSTPYISNCVFTENNGGAIKISHATVQGAGILNFYSNVFDGNRVWYVLSGNCYGSYNNFYNNESYIIRMGSGSSSFNLENNYWGSKDSTFIADELIFDLYDDPSFNTSFADFSPYLKTPTDSTRKNPTTIFDILLKNDSTYQIDLIDSIYISSNIYIQLDAEDKNPYCPDLSAVYIINLSYQDTVFTTLTESGDSTGIFRSVASVQGLTDNINDIIGANVGDEIKIVSKTDPAKHYSFIVAQTPPPDITNLDVGGLDDIFHILDSNPLISWTYSDSLSSPQSAYKVQVGLDTDWNTAEMWDTGEISSSDTSVVFAGSALNEDSTYYVRARVNNGTFWSSWIDTNFALNSYPQMALIDTSVSEDDTLFLNVTNFISDSDDHDSLLSVSSNVSDNIVVNINVISHEASLIPVENWNGSEKIVFICTDPWGFQTIDSLTLTVLPANDPPEITTTELPNAAEDQEYSFTIEATDVDMVYGDHLTYSLAVYPGGMSINSTTGEISWLPNNDDVGDTTVTVVVTDDSSATDMKTYTLTVINVNDPPILSVIPDTSFNEDNRLTVALSYFYSFVDDPDNADSTLSFVFNGTDYINASASVDSILLYAQSNWNGVDAIEVIVRDGSLSDTTSWRIIVNPVNDAPVITSADSVSATEDIHFKYIATAIDIEDSSITFSFDDLPCWLSSDADSVYGIPSEGMRDTSFIVIASDGELNDTLTVILTVINVNDPPTISTIPDTSFNEDEQLKFAISYFYDFVYDPDNADSSLTWSFSETDYVYVTMDEDSVILSSKKDWFGKDTLSVKVSDGEFFDEASFVITVHPVNDPPYFTELMPDSILFDSNVRDTLLLTGLASDVDNPDSSLIWSYIQSSFVLCDINGTLNSAVFWVEENLSGQDTIVLSVSDGEFTVYDSLIVIVSPVTGVEYLMSQIPKEYSLKQNYPNPFNPTTTIIYGLPKLSHVDIRIYDLLGREVTTLVNDNQEAKHYKVTWDAKDRSGNSVPSGMYLYRIMAISGDKTFVKTRKLLLMR